MPPKAGYKAFKPPQPLGGDSKSKSKSKQARKASLSDSEEEDDHGQVDTVGRHDDLDSDDPDVPMNDPVPTNTTSTEPGAIPAKLLARLAHEHFQHDDTRITKEAMSAFAKYIETFAIEAVGRANEEKEETAKNDKNVDASFLEVEDLEKLAPQLLLDF